MKRFVKYFVALPRDLEKEINNYAATNGFKIISINLNEDFYRAMVLFEAEE